MTARLAHLCATELLELMNHGAVQRIDHRPRASDRAAIAPNFGGEPMQRFHRWYVRGQTPLGRIEKIHIVHVEHRDRLEITTHDL